MNENEFAELAAGHALHALSDADEQLFADALAAHPEWQAIADDDVETAHLLADASSTAAPPANIRAALLAQIATTPQSDDAVAARPVENAEVEVDAPFLRPPRRWGRALFGLAAGLVLLVGLGFGVVALTSQLTTPASVVALNEIQSAADARTASAELESGAVATAHWSASVGSAVLVADGLEPLGDDQTYELWFVRGDEPVPAGLFEADAGDATALLEGAMHEGDVIAVTVEPAGGSPTGQPTSDPIIAIPTA
ncbi:anti-sigma factor [Microbacterium sp. AK031]|uniref:anti-sigma factor n=1 Tax=Microbacterium sp. AK031 TaxID=2723076 RepID=UPI0021698799|nr:anti-sigma factor [Microbacterium sp. AK031]MCS3844224.1 anti-sigma-K factor RskA [Microbacterium sp. AK031]